MVRMPLKISSVVTPRMRTGTSTLAVSTTHWYISWERKRILCLWNFAFVVIVHMWQKACISTLCSPLLKRLCASLAIVFGAGKPQTGCLILPSELAKDLSPAELMEKVWPVIEQANAEAPTHSRLLPEMVEFLPYVSLYVIVRQ